MLEVSIAEAMDAAVATQPCGRASRKCCWSDEGQGCGVVAGAMAALIPRVRALRWVAAGRSDCESVVLTDADHLLVSGFSVVSKGPRFLAAMSERGLGGPRVL